MSGWPPSLRPGHPADRLVLLAAVIGVAAAGMGFVAGMRGTEAYVGRLRPSGAAAPPVASDSMPRYADMGTKTRGPNGDLYVNGLAGLIPPTPDLFAPLVQTEAERDALIEARRERRAYDGAPPTIPHAIDERSTGSCRSCHDQGVRVAGKSAPRIPHEPFTNCTQCHAPRRTDSSPPNEFSGVASPGAGTRAWPGAPPTIPHGTRMRSECMSCHGPGGLQGIRTPHPYRESCTQCHVTQGDPAR